MFVSLSFDYRKCCNRSTATPSMPADPPLTLGTLAQISFLTKSCPTLVGCSNFRPKSPPRAGSTLKFCPTARGSTKGVVGCGLSRVLSEDDQCLATLLHPPHTPTPFYCTCTQFGCRYANTFKCTSLLSAKRPKGTARALSATAGAFVLALLDRHVSMHGPPTTMLSSFPRVPPTFMLMVVA